MQTLKMKENEKVDHDEIIIEVQHEQDFSNF